MAVVTVYLVAMIVLILSWKLLKWIKEDVSNIPGPKGVPFLGSIFVVNLERLHHNFYTWSLKYGKIFKIKMCGNTVIVLNDFDFVRKVFADKENRDFFNDRPETFVGKFAVYDTSDVVLCRVNNERSATLKNVLQKSLKHQCQSGSFTRSFNFEMKRLCANIDEFLGKEVELVPVLRHSFANFISILMSGEGVDRQMCDGLWEFNDDAFYLLETSVNLFLINLPFLRHMPGRIGTVYKRMMSSRNEIIEHFFLQCKSNSDRDTDSINGLIYELLEQQRAINEEKGHDYITDENIMGIILDFIAAAMKSSSSATSACFLLLLNHPEHISAIQKEIDEVIGRGRIPEEKDQSKMPFCRAFVYEVFRYISNGSLGLPHLVTKDHTVDQYHFKKDDILFSNIWYIHHDPHFWEGPWQFKPERFLDSDGSLLPASHANMRRFATFSVGRRVCVGKDIALNRIFLYLTNILQKYTIQPPESCSVPSADPREFVPGLFLDPKPFKCRLTKRREE